MAAQCRGSSVRTASTSTRSPACSRPAVAGSANRTGAATSLPPRASRPAPTQSDVGQRLTAADRAGEHPSDGIGDRAEGTGGRHRAGPGDDREVARGQRRSRRSGRAPLRRAARSARRCRRDGREGHRDRRGGEPSAQQPAMPPGRPRQLALPPDQVAPHGSTRSWSMPSSALPHAQVRSAGRAATTSSSRTRSRSVCSAKTRKTCSWLTDSSPFEAGVQVGHQGDRGVAEGQLAGQDSLRVAGHVHQRPALRCEPLRLGSRRETRAVDDHRRPAVVRRPTGCRSSLQRPPARPAGQYGSSNATCTAPVSWNVCARPLVRSTSWSGTTSEPGPSSGRRLPTAHGASTCRTPQARSAQRLARYGIRCGGNRWSTPCRGRKATRRPATSPRTTGPDGAPNGRLDRRPAGRPRAARRALSRRSRPTAEVTAST